MVDVPRTRPTRFYLREIPLPSKPGLLLSTTSKHTNYGGTKQCVRTKRANRRDWSFLVHRVFLLVVVDVALTKEEFPETGS